MGQKEKHLEFIQSVINRMAVNSFWIKGWIITLVAALFVLSAKDSNNLYLLIAFLPIPAFWILDGYYLWQERLFRALYNYVRVKNGDQIDFSMKTNDLPKEFTSKKDTWIRSIFSITLGIFYGSLFAIMLIVMFLLCVKKGV
ncbi:MAG: hypothetical protein AAB038_01860 [Planctomycetota bacterium]